MMPGDTLLSFSHSSRLSATANATDFSHSSRIHRHFEGLLHASCQDLATLTYSSRLRHLQHDPRGTSSRSPTSLTHSSRFRSLQPVVRSSQARKPNSANSHSLFTSSSFATRDPRRNRAGRQSLTLHVFVICNLACQVAEQALGYYLSLTLHVDVATYGKSSRRLKLLCRVRRRFDLSRRLSLTLHVFVVCNLSCVPGRLMYLHLSHSLFTSSSFATVAVVSAGVVIGVLSLFTSSSFTTSRFRSPVHMSISPLSLTLHVFVGGLICLVVSHSLFTSSSFATSNVCDAICNGEALTLHVFVVCNA